MPLLRIRTAIEDRPGRLAGLTAALAAQGANILDLSVQVDTEGVVDEFVVDMPADGTGRRASMLEDALEDAGGRRTTVVPARPRELIDEPTRVLALAARLRAAPRLLPQVLTELLRADEAEWVTVVAAPEQPAHMLDVPVGHLRAVRLHRAGLPFTVTEAARADALVRAVLPMYSPRPSSRKVLLKDGTEITVRPLETGDRDAVRALHERCSLETRRLRYFSAKPYLPERALDLFCEPSHGLTLTAAGPDGSLLALAHLIHVLDPGVAELAFLVEDAWQGRGLGRALTDLMLALARDRGLVELRATVLAENTRMHRLLSSAGARFKAAEGGRQEVRLRLDGRPALFTSR